MDVYMQHGGNVNVTSSLGEGLLAAAIQRRDRDLFNWCLEKGASVSHADKFQRTPLHVAAEYNDVAALERLLQRGANVNALDENGDTPLLEAVRRCNLLSAQFLLRHEADVNSLNGESCTPLHVAVETADLPMVSLILSYCPKLTCFSIRGPMMTTFDGKSICKAMRAPLLQAMKDKNYEIMEKILQSNDDRTARENFLLELNWAINSEHRAAAEMLLRHGVDLDSGPFSWHSVIGMLMNQNSTRLVHLVVQHHAHATCPDPRENFLLRYVVGTFYKLICLSVNGHKKTMECRLTAALLHCGLSLNCLREATKEGKFDNCECSRLVQPIKTGVIQPVTLKAASRTVIRCRLGLGLSKKIDTLALPKPLKRYLMLEPDRINVILNPFIPANELSVNVWA